MLYAVPDTTAETAVEAALLDKVGRFGVQIMTDGDRRLLMNDALNYLYF